VVINQESTKKDENLSDTPKNGEELRIRAEELIAIIKQNPQMKLIAVKPGELTAIIFGVEKSSAPPKTDLKQMLKRYPNIVNRTNDPDGPKSFIIGI
jgi:hypothetical protein